MSINITIGNQVIKFPSDGDDALWSPAIIDFAQAVADQLSGISSEFDISPRVQILASDSNTNLNVEDVIFPSGSVRSFVLTYSIYRTNGVITLAEDGILSGVYNTVTSTWGLQHEFNGDRQPSGDSYHTFSMSGDQVTISTVSIGGVYDNINSKLSYQASTLLVSN